MNIYVDAVNLAKYYILSTLINTPGTLLEEYNKCEGEYELLIYPNVEHFLLLYKLLKVIAFHTDKTTIFSIRIPLILKIHYLCIYYYL